MEYGIPQIIIRSAYTSHPIYLKGDYTSTNLARRGRKLQLCTTFLAGGLYGTSNLLQREYMNKIDKYNRIILGLYGGSRVVPYSLLTTSKFLGLA